MGKVKITSDSISDLGHLFAERGIACLPIPIILGDREGLDGEITPEKHDSEDERDNAGSLL